MNCSLAVLCWIAISTLLGIFFGYSSLELTTSTSIVALLLGLVLAGTPLFLQRGGIRIDPPERRHFVAFAMSIFFLVFAVREFGQVVFVAKDEVRVISPNNLGDICLHLTQINYLASGPHFWPENPIFAFDKLRYPIGLNVFNAELKLVGIEPKLGIILLGLIGSLITLRALFLFNGSSFQRWPRRFSFLPIICSEGLPGRRGVEINPPRHVRDTARFALRRAGRFAAAASLENHAPGQTPRKRDARLGRMASLLHDAALPSAHLPLFVVPAVLVVSVRRPKLAWPSSSINSALTDPRHILRLRCHRVCKNRSDRLEAGLDGWPERGALVVLDPEFWPVSTRFFRAAGLSPDSCQTAGPRRQTTSSALVLPGNGRLPYLYRD
jgi:hypothetical protein